MGSEVAMEKESVWTEVKPKGFWPRLKYELIHNCLGEFAPDAEYVNEHGVRRFIRASDGQSRIDVNSLMRSPKVRRHMRQIDRLVKGSRRKKKRRRRRVNREAPD